MPSYSKGDVVLVKYPFSNASDFKVRPAIAVSAHHISQDIFVVPLTSRTDNLLVGEFLMKTLERSRSQRCLGSKARSFYHPPASSDQKDG